MLDKSDCHIYCEIGTVENIMIIHVLGNATNLDKNLDLICVSSNI
jgi:hypothetical protein